MNPPDEEVDVAATLEALGIDVPAQDIPFLQRTRQRQRELLRAIGDRIRPETEPAHAFKVGGD